MNLYVYGSSEKIVKDGLAAANIKGNYRSITVKEGTMFHIDDAGKITFAEFEVNYSRYNKWNPLYSVAGGSKKSTFDYEDSWYEKYDLEAIVTKDLFDLGYTYRETQLLFDSFSIRELDSAIYSDKIDALLLMALRDWYEESESDSCNRVIP
jgi:hypothetical protein